VVVVTLLSSLSSLPLAASFFSLLFWISFRFLLHKPFIAKWSSLSLLILLQLIFCSPLNSVISPYLLLLTFLFFILFILYFNYYYYYLKVFLKAYLSKKLFIYLLHIFFIFIIIVII
jgi:hypothetical protein